MTLSEREFDKLGELIYARAGIALRMSKVDFLSRRVVSRLAALDLTTVKDYIRYLSFERDGRELEILIEAVTIGETYFFRDYPQLQLLAEELLPDLVKEKGRAQKLNVLCAGCATGEEPYTLAIILREMLERAEEWRLRIDALDINRASLEKARAGIYTDHALRETPYLYRDRYFSRQGDLHRLDPEIRDMVGFKRVNLFDSAQMAHLRAYDIVLCRNVLIYFDRDSAGQVMECFYKAMNPGGVIFLGSSESVGRVSSLFEMVRLGGSFVYRKKG